MCKGMIMISVCLGIYLPYLTLMCNNAVFSTIFMLTTSNSLFAMYIISCKLMYILSCVFM